MAYKNLKDIKAGSFLKPRAKPPRPHKSKKKRRRRGHSPEVGQALSEIFKLDLALTRRLARED